MGLSILELVLSRLREAGFRAEEAYPGQKHPPITTPVAAVHILKLDRSKRAVTVEISILCPAALGGTECEKEALGAVEALHEAGGACVQSGCQYDGHTRTYRVDIQAEFNSAAGEETGTVGLGFTVYVQDVLMEHTVAFTAEQHQDNALRYAMGEAEPVGTAVGSSGWKLQLVEQLPVGAVESAEPAGAFRIRVERSTGEAETYYNCLWTSVKREFSRDGIRCTSTGIAVVREVS